MKPALTSVSRENPRHQNPPDAFSRLDALVVCATIALLSAICIPALAHTAARSERLLCLNNLRMIGFAFNAWSADHGNNRPFRVPESQGGTFPALSKLGAAWYEFAWVSNTLGSPQLLVCPSDINTRRVAVDFGHQPDRGFVHFNYRNNALSYFLHLDVGTRNPTGPTRLMPELSNHQVLAGDRNVQVDVDVAFCSSLIVNAATILPNVDGLSQVARSGWTNGIHQFSGNLLMNDGRVQESSLDDFRKAFVADDNGAIHILLPR